MDEKRRHPRFSYSGAALIVVEEAGEGPVFVLTSYGDVSLGGASLHTPDPASSTDAALAPGSRVRLLTGEGDRGRAAVIVQASEGKLRLRLEGTDELTEFDLARLLKTGEPSEET